MASLRVSLVGLGLAALLGAPLFALHAAGVGAAEALAGTLSGLSAAVDAVGWVFVPQFVLAVAIVGLALQQLSARAAGVALAPAPPWLDAAIESALLLGMLGTISGMVRGFVGISPEELQPGPLVHALGSALRSSFVGFAIALVGVWTRVRAS